MQADRGHYKVTKPNINAMDSMDISGANNRAGKDHQRSKNETHPSVKKSRSAEQTASKGEAGSQDHPGLTTKANAHCPNERKLERGKETGSVRRSRHQ